ncbi:GNAT family N-acetyltransferase [Chelatococcus sp. YT9]|uniref:GNAT family N-acetyltransferase n=1 Tax=Chelatococcus sp. YT9 TaxID=2835635 RepID=UPI001BCB982B|nr:GNAT family N-acetyltransferase [Chelatococcus sp. YT9]MBS7701311.1 GNAT family N-acetyltransferase [Chelatococcus sp. YT9]
MTDATIRPIMHDDRDQWLPLWEGYNSFYERVVPPDVTHATWQRFFDHYEPVHAHVAEREGQLLGLVHYIFHRNTSMIAPVCYLQDLFTSPSARGLGIGRQLIEAVYGEAQKVGSPRVYWLTHETNSQAMMLYDKVAERSGFVQYRKQIA